jgi:ubiquinone/menaquinone biosynthesis C-methylase UbiE
MKINGEVPDEERRSKAKLVQIASSREGRILKNAGSSILDVGCGDGRYVGALLLHGYEIYGVDLAPRPHSANISRYLIKGDVHHLPFKNRSFDPVLLINVLEHLNDFMALRKAYRICRKNVIFSAPH